LNFQTLTVLLVIQVIKTNGLILLLY